jgi:hypothetical protein
MRAICMLTQPITSNTISNIAHFAAVTATVSATSSVLVIELFYCTKLLFKVPVVHQG